MRHCGFAVAMLLSCAVGATALEHNEPRFADYPSVPDAGHRPVHPKLDDPKAARYASVFKAAAKRPVDFAGHFVLATAGCGAGCLVAGAIDAGTGAVTMLPFTVSDWPPSVSEPLTFKVDSRLLKIEGSRNEKGHGIYFYAFDGIRFKLVAAPTRRSRTVVR